MFTGIIEKQGRIRSVSGKDLLHLVIEKSASWKLRIGASVAVDGICLTVTSKSTTTFSCDIMPETLERTTARMFKKGAGVNLERPLKVGDEIGGHIVQGHVDSVGHIVDIKKLGVSSEMSIAVSSKYLRMVREKGSVTINGVSLTVARKNADRFTVALIPHTLKTTNLGKLKEKDCVNVEVDDPRRTLAAFGQK
jgi:riboflavin synthase